MKKIAVLGAGIYNIEVYNKLKQGGFYTIAVDGNANAPAAVYAHEFVHLNFHDKNLLLAYFSKNSVNGIMPLNDWGTISAAFVTSQLGLAGISEDAAIASCDKGIMRTLWKNAGLPVPEFFVFKTLEELLANISKVGFPCVVKPTFSGGGGRGISVLKSIDDAEWAFNFAKPYVHNGRFICEAFVEGTELTIETISIEGEVYVLAMSDKYKPDLRTRVATSLNYPAKLTPEQKQIVENTVKSAVKTLGIHTAMAHTEAIISGKEVKLVETGARGGGSHIFPFIIEAVSGINAPVICASLLCGDKPIIEKTTSHGTTYRFFNPPNGILRNVKGMEKVKNLPGILDMGMLKKNGEEVGNLKNSFERAGHLIATGKTRDEAAKLADEAEKLLEFEIDPIPE
jgi:biotin carboxylase